MTDHPEGTDGARERALAAWFDREWPPGFNGFERLCESWKEAYRAGYDAARAEADEQYAQSLRLGDDLRKAEARAEQLERELQTEHAALLIKADELEAERGKLAAMTHLQGNTFQRAERLERELAAERERVRLLLESQGHAAEASTRAVAQLLIAESALATEREQCKVWEGQAVRYARALDTEREQTAALRDVVERVRAMCTDWEGAAAVYEKTSHEDHARRNWVEFATKAEVYSRCAGLLRAALASAPATDAHPKPEWEGELPFDGQEQAKLFRAMALHLGYSDMPLDWLTGWFANATMRGYDEHARRASAPAPEAGPACAVCEYGDTGQPMTGHTCKPTPPPRAAECTAEDLRRALLDACIESRSPWLRVSAVVDALVEADRRAAKEGTET